MTPQTILILIVSNVLAAVVLIVWYLLDHYTKRIEKLLQSSQKPSCAFIQAQQKHKG